MDLRVQMGILKFTGTPDLCQREWRLRECEGSATVRGDLSMYYAVRASVVLREVRTEHRECESFVSPGSSDTAGLLALVMGKGGVPRTGQFLAEGLFSCEILCVPGVPSVHAKQLRRVGLG